MLIIDELHHLLASRLEPQRIVLNTLKFLGNDLQIPLVGVGAADALRAIQTDPQLANRFRPLALPKWTLNDEYRKLLASFERLLPGVCVPVSSAELVRGAFFFVAEGFTT